MATNFPSSLDNNTTLPNPASTDTLASPDHGSLHDNENLAIIAIENKLGIGVSTPSGSNLLISTGTGTSAWSKAAPAGSIVGTTDVQTLTNKILTSPTINSPTITSPTITGSLGNITIGTLTASGLITANSGITASNGFTLSAGALTLPNASIVASNIDFTTLYFGQATDVSNFSTSSAALVLVTGVTLTFTVPIGVTKIMLTAGTNFLGANGNLNIVKGVIGSGGASIIGFNQGTGNAGATLSIVDTVTPGSSVTYQLGAASGSGTITIGGSSTSPIYLNARAVG